MPIDGSFLRLCKQGALQFVVLKPILAVLTLLLEHFKLYEDGVYQWDKGYAYIAFLYNISYTAALYGLLMFYVAASDLLAPHKPILKARRTRGGGQRGFQHTSTSLDGSSVLYQFLRTVWTR